ncbi:MAG: hypothetical protein K8F91_14335 [Candidatus Obscuribacterales bacterium]|nr:hypothetical protein [Candidatus Obscuribacterales bacterium]
MNRNRSTVSVCLSLLIALLTVAPVCADVTEQLNVEGELVSADSQYVNIQKGFSDKLAKLEKLGGGIKPFADRAAQVEEMNARGESAAAIKVLESLDRSIDAQLKSIEGLRAVKPKVAKQVASSNSTAVAKNLLMILASSEIGGKKLLSSETLASVDSSTFANFQGNANEYLEKVAQDLVARELGGLAIPVKGPFRLERFRNVQRISELRKHGKRVDNFLYQYQMTEQLAQAAGHDAGRVEELSSQVRYLGQQLGLCQLTGSIRNQSY